MFFRVVHAWEGRCWSSCGTEVPVSAPHRTTGQLSGSLGEVVGLDHEPAPSGKSTKNEAQEDIEGGEDAHPLICSGTMMPTLHSEARLHYLGCWGQLRGNILGACHISGVWDGHVPCRPASPPLPVSAELSPFSCGRGWHTPALKLDVRHRTALRWPRHWKPQSHRLTAWFCNHNKKKSVLKYVIHCVVCDETNTAYTASPCTSSAKWHDQQI